MKKIARLISVMALSALVLTACKTKNEAKDEGTSNLEVVEVDQITPASPAWKGSYTGTLPCADCSGISVHLTLNPDFTYVLNYQYLGKGEDTIYPESGSFTLNEAGDIVSLDITEWPSHYQIGENKLTQLDMDGAPITGELASLYVLTKDAAK